MFVKQSISINIKCSALFERDVFYLNLQWKFIETPSTRMTAEVNFSPNIRFCFLDRMPNLYEIYIDARNYQ